MTGDVEHFGFGEMVNMMIGVMCVKRLFVDAICGGEGSQGGKGGGAFQRPINDRNPAMIIHLDL